MGDNLRLHYIKLFFWAKYLFIDPKMEGNLPSFNGFLRVVNKHYKIDKYIAKMTQKYEIFKMKWLRYKDLFDPSQ